MNLDQLLAIGPVGARGALFLPHLNASMERWDIGTKADQACFIAQGLHESLMLAKMIESLNYSPDGLIATFNNSRVTRFTQQTAAQYGRVEGRAANQPMIGNIAYANRMGNGSIESGDGYRYRGRGLGHLTGKDNYRLCGDELDVDLVGSPDQVAQPEIGCQSFGWFWARGNPTGKSLGRLASDGKFDEISRAVNGGNNGLVERRALTMLALEVLG